MTAKRCPLKCHYYQPDNLLRKKTTINFKRARYCNIYEFKTDRYLGFSPQRTNKSNRFLPSLLKQITKNRTYYSVAFSFSINFLPLIRVMAGLEPIQATTGQEAGYTPDRLPIWGRVKTALVPFSFCFQLNLPFQFSFYCFDVQILVRGKI